ncbi:MAG: hypothetical protein RIE32_05415 [Phycisphaerales bacterium]
MATPDHTSSVPARSPTIAFLGRSGFGLAMAVLLFTALIWLRLRLVTDVPRQAYAVPEARQSQTDGRALSSSDAGDASTDAR